MDGSFFQNRTTKQPGCQIDDLIQTGFNSLFLCEIKCSKYLIGQKIIKEMETTRKKLKTPKCCSIRPILIHVNGGEEGVLARGYFDTLIDFGQLLK